MIAQSVAVGIRCHRHGNSGERAAVHPRTTSAETKEVRDKPDELVWAVLATLPRGQRAVLVLRFYEGLSEAETAVVLGCSTGSVKSQTAKAKTKIKAALQAAQAQEEALWTR